MSALTPIRTKAETALMAQFEALRGELPKGAKGKRDPGKAARDAAMAAFAASGLPHRRIEAYHYTDLRNLLRDAAPLAQLPSGTRRVGASRPAVFWAISVGHEIIIVNGRLMDAAELAAQLPEGVSIATTAATLPRRSSIRTMLWSR